MIRRIGKARQAPPAWLELGHCLIRLAAVVAVTHHGAGGAFVHMVNGQEIPLLPEERDSLLRLLKASGPVVQCIRD